MTRAFEAIIFDMDGVIVDSEPRHEQAFREVFREMGREQDHGIDFPHYFGRSDRALWTDFLAIHKPEQSIEELMAWKQRRFLEIIRSEQPIFGDLPPLLDKLAVGHRLAVASGSTHPVIDEVLSMRDLRRYFQAVVSVQDVARSKPAPDVFLRAAELLRIAPERCCVIEDAAAGVEGARAAGMHVIAITNSLPAEKLRHAHYIVATYAEIERILLE
jgi:HAD superfamily hydrolase (TIGR01509 family)